MSEIGDSKNVNLKIGSREPKKLRPSFSLFLMSKPLSSAKVVSEALLPTYQGYVSLEKWSKISVLGPGSARTESEEKAIVM